MSQPLFVFFWLDFLCECPAGYASRRDSKLNHLDAQVCGDRDTQTDILRCILSANQ